MITHFDKRLSAADNGLTQEQYNAYLDLFEDIRQAAGIQTEIMDLTDYFYALSRLDSDVARHFSFWRIPLDEEPFKIDTNTRIITIPKNFTTHGLGVQGDHLAEVVFFQVDRFFDAVDLASCNPAYQGADAPYHGGIRIQWRNSSDHDIYGASDAVMVDATEDKILFGWPIHDAMTEKAGKIEFGVRFYQYNEENEIIFSLSTATATCDIKAALDFENIASMDADNFEENLLFHRPIYAGIVNTIVGAAPKILTNLDGDAEYNLNEDGVCTLQVVVETPTLPENAEPGAEPDTIVYRWFKDNVQLYVGEELADEASYDATVAGTYYVKVGRYNRRNGTRWVSSLTAYIPAASGAEFVPAEVEGGSVVPAQSYTGETALKLAIAKKSAGDADKYQWYQYSDVANLSLLNPAEAVAIEGAVSAIYEPEAEGIYECRGWTERNNTTTAADYISSGFCVIRNTPVIPTKVNLVNDTENHVLVATVETTANVNLSERKLYYQWTSVNNGKICDPTAGKDTLAYDPDRDANDEIYCRVWEYVFPGSVVERKSATFKESNHVTIE